MRRAILVAITIISLAGFAALGFAQEAKGKSSKAAKAGIEVIKGKIVSIYPDKNEIVIKDNNTEVAKTVVVDAKEISSLKVGEELKIKLRAGSNVADSIKKIKSTKK